MMIFFFLKIITFKKNDTNIVGENHTVRESHSFHWFKQTASQIYLFRTRCDALCLNELTDSYANLGRHLECTEKRTKTPCHFAFLLNSFKEFRTRFDVGKAETR